MWNIVSTVLGLTGIVLAVFFYFKGIPVKKISYSKKSFSLLGKSTMSLDGFSAYYQGQELPALKASKIILWNDGNTTISSSDIASSQKLSIQFLENDKVLESRILSVSSKSNDISLTVDSGRSFIGIEFDYLDPGQGLVISVLHTGDEERMNIKGVIKGGSIEKYESLKWPKVLGYTALFCAIGLMFMIILDLVNDDYINYTWFIVPVQIIGIVLISGENLFLKRSAQKSLDISFEEGFTSEDFKV